ncbi:MAG: hypothetical protein GY832_37980 [Chloroflexi bacterium]|nr:hypothetical protein [Chloroflexota bacterium]
MLNKSLYKVGLVAAILSTVGWFAYVFGSMSSPDMSGLDGRQLFQAYQDARSTLMFYSWGGVFGALLTIPYALAFHYATKDAGAVRSLATTTLVIGSVLTALGFMKTLTHVYFFTPAALAAPADQLQMIEIAARFAGQVFEVPWFFGSFLAYGLGAGLMAVHAWRTATGPKWLNGVGIVAGLSGIVWLRHFFPFLMPLEALGSLVNILTVTVWCIGLSVVLVRQKEPANQ